LVVPPQQLTFTLGPGAPTNALLDATSGIFQWRPTAAQAPSTNVISITVTDNGVPPLSATRQFTVIVRAVANEFFLSLGSTNVLAGQNSALPLVLQSTLDLTNLTAVVSAPAERLANLSLLSASLEASSTTLLPAGSNQYAANLTLNPAFSPGGTRTLAQLGFLAVTQAHSAEVPVGLSQPVGLRSDGSLAPKPGAAGGLVFVIGQEPLLEALPAGRARGNLVLFGHPGASYELEYSTNLASWTPWRRVPLTNSSELFSNVPQGKPALFYRAYEFTAEPPVLDAFLSRQNRSLVAYGRPGTNYVLEYSTDLFTWYPLLSYSLSNSFQFFNNLSNSAPIIFYRLQRP
jgi:hypothetical protein